MSEKEMIPFENKVANTFILRSGNKKATELFKEFRNQFIEAIGIISYPLNAVELVAETYFNDWEGSKPEHKKVWPHVWEYLAEFTGSLQIESVEQNDDKPNEILVFSDNSPLTKLFFALRNKLVELDPDVKLVFRYEHSMPSFVGVWTTHGSKNTQTHLTCDQFYSVLGVRWGISDYDMSLLHGFDITDEQAVEDNFFEEQRKIFNLWGIESDKLIYAAFE